MNVDHMERTKLQRTDRNRSYTTKSLLCLTHYIELYDFVFAYNIKVKDTEWIFFKLKLVLNLLAILKWLDV